MELKRISDHRITIRHTINGGIIAKIGCAELSFSSPEDMMDVMKQYYEDPKGMEKKYNEVMGNDVTDEPPQPHEHEEGTTDAPSTGRTRRAENRHRPLPDGPQPEVRR